MSEQRSASLKSIVQKHRPVALRVSVSGGQFRDSLTHRDSGALLVNEDNSSNYEILKRWIGARAADPEREIISGQRVISFAVRVSRDPNKFDMSGRLTPLSPDEVRSGEYRRQLDKLRVDLQAVQERDASLLTLKNGLLQHFDAIIQQPETAGFYFFRDQNRRVVWCWGYHRSARDHVPGPQVCPRCRLLGLAGEPCSLAPTHSSEVVTAGVPRRRSWLWAVAAASLLLLAGVGGWWQFGRNAADPAGTNSTTASAETPVSNTVARLEITPSEDLTLPRGGRQAFRVERVEGEKRTDVTPWVRIAVDDLRVARIARDSSTVEAVGAGRTKIRFDLGDLKAQQMLAVTPPEEPISIKLVPERLEVGVGTTDHFRLLARYADDREIDLSSSAEWSSTQPEAIYVYYGGVQGKRRGSGEVIATYQAGTDSKRWEARSPVDVLDERYVSLDFDSLPETLEVGGTLNPRLYVATASGQRRNVGGSTELQWNVSPPGKMELENGTFTARSVGRVRLAAVFRELRAEREIQIVAAAHATSFAVSPASLEIAVGEEVELTIDGATSELSVESDQPMIASVREKNRVVGLAPGVAQIAFVSGGQTAAVQVAVVRQDFSQLSFNPSRYAVPLLGRTSVQVFAQTSQDPARSVRVAPELLEWPQLPDVDSVEFDAEKLELRGLRETPVPSALTARWENLEATAEVSVVALPLALELTPQGELTLPVGQVLPLQVWAASSAGERVEVAASDVEWRLEGATEETVRWTPGALSALRPGATIQLEARLAGQSSNTVQVKTVDRDPQLSLQLAPMLDVVFLDETGQWSLLAASEQGPVEIDAQATRFSSSDPALLEVNETTGEYRARGVGEVAVTGVNPAGESVSRTVRIVRLTEGTLTFEPAMLRIPVATQHPVRLVFRSPGHEDIDCTDRAGVTWALSAAQNVTWNPPTISAVRPGPPVTLTARLANASANATIEVVANEELANLLAEATNAAPAASSTSSADASDATSSQANSEMPAPETANVNESLRIVPSEVALRVRESAVLQVEQLVDEQWRVVRPGDVTWTVPEGLEWTPPQGDLPPRLTAPVGSSGPAQLTARFGRARATMTVVINEASTPLPDLADPSTDLFVERDPPGDRIAVGGSQRMIVMIRTPEGNLQAPAEQVNWPAAFSNEFVRWNPPVLTALRAPHRQPLRVEAGGRSLLVMTDLVNADQSASPSPSLADSLPSGPPTSVRVTSDQGETISLARGIRYSRIQILAAWEGTPERDVSEDASLKLESSGTTVAIEGTSIVGLQPGDATLRARYRDQVSGNRLTVSVAEQLALTRIELTPLRATLAVGESARLHASGYVGDQFAGDLDDHPELRWQSLRREGAESVVVMNGSTVTAVGLGTAGVTAQIGDIVSDAAEVTVASTPPLSSQTRLSISPATITLRVSETRRLDQTVQITRDGLDLLNAARLASSDDGIVSYDPERGELRGNAAGTASLAVSAGAARGEIRVVVVADAPAASPAGRRIMLDPSRVTLSPGQTQEIRVLELLENGETLDRTGQATLVSSQPALGSLLGNTVRGETAGEATVEARVPGVAAPATALVTVVDDQLRDFIVEPSTVTLAPGQSSALRVSAVGAGIRRSLVGHRHLVFAVASGGESIVQVDSQGRLFAQQPGSAQVSTHWGDRALGQTTVVVTSGESDRLEIHPSLLEVSRGQTGSFLVYVWQQGARRPLGASDGVQLAIGNPSVADAAGGLRVRGREAGTSEVAVSWGIHRASARVRVAPDSRSNSPMTSPTNSDNPDSGSSPTAARTERVEFSTSVLRCAPDQIARPLTVYAVDNLGRRRDVSLAARLQLTSESPADVVELAAGSTAIVPRSAGVVHVQATWGEWTTSPPLRVEVAAAENTPRLRVSPNPLSLTVGETRPFQRVELVFPGEQAALPVDADMTSSNPEVVSVTGSVVQARQAGRATVRVRSRSSQMNYEGIETTVLVDVQSLASPVVENASNPARESRARLILSGPEHTTVGAQIGFAVNLVQGTRGIPVTEEAELLVTPISGLAGSGGPAQARVTSGGLLTAIQPGIVHLQARHGGLISNPMRLRIDPPAARFASLRIEMDEQPMRVGESRGYRVWGTPIGETAAQDITGLVGTERGVSTVLVAVRNRERVVHEPPRISANEAGSIELLAVHGETRSNRVAIEIVSSSDTAPTAMWASPTRLTLRQGDTTRAPRATVRFSGDAAVRDVPAEWRSDNSEVLRPLESDPSSFVAQSPGAARLVAQWNGATTAVNVTVVGGMFGGVEILSQQQQGEDFTVTLEVRGAAPRAEYRLVKPGEAIPGEWRGVTPAANQTTVRLTSPRFRIQLDNLYQLVIEARVGISGQVERYPFVFLFRPQVPRDSGGTTPTR
ncbi:MAG: hypothetical protein U1A77_19315 [Pirellulales bacterium]